MSRLTSAATIDDVLDHATSGIALPREIEHSRGPLRITRDYLTGRGSKLGLDATKKLAGEGFKRPWPPLIKMDESVKARVAKILNL
jgi:4-hydroxy-3-polyprenylbenzoate decarboxylase